MIKLNVLNIVFKFSLLTLLFTCICSASFAGDLPNHYPKSFIWSGTVNKISNDTIIIGDRSFRLTNRSSSFHRLDSHSSRIQDIDIGIVVGCVVSDSNEIISLWEFPDKLKTSIGPWAAGMQNIKPQ